MKQLIYISIAEPNLSTEALQSILDTAQRNNAAHAVTGMLLYNTMFFCQVLEGPEESIALIYKKLALDARHHDLLVYLNRHTHARAFGEWSMAYINGANPEIHAMLARYGMENGFLPHSIDGLKLLELLLESRRFATLHV